MWFLYFAASFTLMQVTRAVDGVRRDKCLESFTVFPGMGCQFQTGELLGYSQHTAFTMPASCIEGDIDACLMDCATECDHRLACTQFQVTETLNNKLICQILASKDSRAALESRLLDAEKATCAINDRIRPVLETVEGAPQRSSMSSSDLPAQLRHLSCASSVTPFARISGGWASASRAMSHPCECKRECDEGSARCDAWHYHVLNHSSMRGHCQLLIQVYGPLRMIHHGVSDMGWPQTYWLAGTL